MHNRGASARIHHAVPADHIGRTPQDPTTGQTRITAYERGTATAQAAALSFRSSDNPDDVFSRGQWGWLADVVCSMPGQSGPQGLARMVSESLIK